MKHKEEKADKFPRLLVCEGYEDALFFHNLIEVRKWPRFHIRPAKGKDKIGEAIRAYKAEVKSNYPGIGDILVIGDNDDDPKKSFQRICLQINEAFETAVAPSKELIASKSKPRCTVMMLPLGQGLGALESILLNAARSCHKGTASSIDNFLADVKLDAEKEGLRYDKAWLRSYLAARCPDPCAPLGEVFDIKAYKKLVPLDHKSFDDIARILRGIDKKGA